MPQRSDTDRAAVARLVHETVAAILPQVPAEQITGDKHLKDLGADSVDRVEIIMALIDALGVREPMAGFSTVPHIDALIDFLVEVKRR
ncbi:phosphopantetheine-binding protein [Streptomyces sp. NPDC006622]|uniref:acyl carrier protein n=1 Tax=Streptomyces sp. NPDC006622 TaxID=3155459 RepID=UPI0033ADFC35